MWMRAMRETTGTDGHSMKSGPSAVATRSLVAVAMALLTPFLFLPHYPPSFLVLRMISERTLRLDDFGALISRLLS
jgi:hypothetical protein